MILLIDNYDSFTYNLYQYLLILGEDVQVERNDAIDLEAIEAMDPGLIVLSPGPGGPESAGVCGPVVRRFRGRIPILGICLGMQVIARELGGSIVEASEPVHGKLRQVTHLGEGLFQGLPSPLGVVRYHSLVVERETVSAALRIDAESETGEVMALSHREMPLWGVQFHPEAVLTERGLDLLANAVSLARVGQASAAG